jgi:hypothetical protein
LTTKADLQRDALLAFGAFLIAFILWQFRPFSPIVFPLRLFVTFIHELGHGTIAIVTGGEFIRFEVYSNGAGLAYSRGGFRPAIISAGYVGTAIFGASLLYATNRVKYPQRIALVLGIAFIAFTLLFSGLGVGNFNILEVLLTLTVIGVSGFFFLTRPTDRGRAYAAAGLVVGAGLLLFFAAGSNLATVFVGILSGIGLVLLSYYGTRNLNLFILNFLAFAVGLNAITDAWVLLRIINNSPLVPQNDAGNMAREVAFSAPFWAITWIITAVLLLGISTWFTFIKPMRENRL